MLKASEVEQLKKGLERQIHLYNEILSVSEKEAALLRERAALPEVLETLPQKMSLMQEISTLDTSLKTVKNEWTALRARGESLPPEILPLLKNLESLINAVIHLDEKNQAMIHNYSITPPVASKPRDLKAAAALRARDAYGRGSAPSAPPDGSG